MKPKTFAHTAPQTMPCALSAPIGPLPLVEIVQSEAIDPDPLPLGAFDPIAIGRALLRSRARRRALFGPDIFGEPVWDILLDLFVSEGEARCVSVSSACIASNVPTTTALRHIAVMEEQGLIHRRGDPRDGRRVFIQLSDRAREAMVRWITEFVANGGAGALS